MGAKHVGIIQSLLTTCRLHNVDPYTYLVNALQRVALHPARDVQELNQRVEARLKMLESMQTHIEMMRFNPGQRASFEHDGGRLMGPLVKYDRKTVTVVTDSGQRWNISPHLLSLVKDAGTAEPQQPTGKKRKRLR